MNTPALELHFHLTDSKIARFVQNDEASAQKILRQIQPNRLFAQHHITLSCQGAMTSIPSSAIVRLDLITDNPPEWPFHYGASVIQEINEEEFRHRFRPQDYAAPPTPGQIVTFYGEMELRSAERVYLEAQIRIEPRLPLEQSVFIQQIFATGGMHARRRGNGMVIINPANIVRFSFYPGPSDIVPGVWAAEIVRD